MSTAMPPEPQDPAPPKKKRNWWVWISAGLLVAVVGLLIWALNAQSDADQSKEDATKVAAGYKSAYEDTTSELGATNEDLAQIEADLKDAEQSASDAEKAAEDAANASDQAQSETEKAKTDADKAKAEADKANAEADKAKAEKDAAESKAKIAADCAKSYLSALGGLFEGDDPSAAADAVKKQLQGITADCKKALESS